MNIESIITQHCEGHYHLEFTEDKLPQMVADIEKYAQLRVIEALEKLLERSQTDHMRVTVEDAIDTLQQKLNIKPPRIRF